MCESFACKQLIQNIYKLIMSKLSFFLNMLNEFIKYVMNHRKKNLVMVQWKYIYLPEISRFTI